MRAVHLPTILLLAGVVAAAPAAAQDAEEASAMQTTPSGLRYEVLHDAGDGAHPKMGETVVVHYTGTLEDGSVFDSSRERGEPAKFQLGQVIEGWNEGLQLMSEGDRYRFVIPPTLGYGPQSMPGIPANSTLVFDVELLDVISAPEFQPVDESEAQTTPNKVKCQVLEEGDGEPVGADAVVSLEFAFWDEQGNLREYSGDQLLTRPCSQMPVAFLREVVPQMKKGSVWLMKVPADQAFGGRLMETTTWRVTLADVMEPMPTPEFVLPAGDGVQSTPSGLKYEVVREGSGEPPGPSDTVRVHYAGWLTDGTSFDSSYGRGQPAEFPLNRVIRGWTEGLQLMRPGAVYRFVIPPDLAYGAQGRPNIPPNSTLVFQVELLEVK